MGSHEEIPNMRKHVKNMRKHSTTRETMRIHLYSKTVNKSKHDILMFPMFSHFANPPGFLCFLMCSHVWIVMHGFSILSQVCCFSHPPPHPLHIPCAMRHDTCMAPQPSWTEPPAQPPPHPEPDISGTQAQACGWARGQVGRQWGDASRGEQNQGGAPGALYVLLTQMLTNVPYISENEKQYFTCYTLYHLAFQPMAPSGGHRDLAAACLTCWSRQGLPGTPVLAEAQCKASWAGSMGQQELGCPGQTGLVFQVASVQS